jgi:hypothetical protein
MDAKLVAAAALGAALALSAAPAQAQQGPAMGFSGTRSESTGLRGVPREFRGAPRHFDGCRDIDRRHMRGDVRRDGRFGCQFGDGFAYADGEWALYNNRAFDPDSYNGWWNDRPDRAFPRWVQEQHARGTCDPNRMWWSGSGWHC